MAGALASLVPGSKEEQMLLPGIHRIIQSSDNVSLFNRAMHLLLVEYQLAR